jgi:hypothetical protein
MDLALAAASTGKRRWLCSRYFPVLFAALVAGAYLSFSQALFNDGDTSWHLAAGKMILETGSVPGTDPFSFTFFGRPWIAHEWLAEVILAAGFNWNSWAGVALVTAIAVSALLLILGVELSRWHQPRRAFASLMVAFILLAPSILARPHVLAWPFLASWVLILLRAREAGRSPPLALPLVMLVWANLHGSFVLGLLLIAAFGLEAVLQNDGRWRALVGWGGSGCASLLAALLTPHGLQGLLFPIEVSSMQSLPLIAEWRPTSLSQDWLFLGVVAASAVLVVRQRASITLVRLALLAGLLYLAIAHARHQPILVIVGTLLLAKPLTGGSLQSGKTSGDFMPVIAAMCLGFLVIGAVRTAVPVERKDTLTYPIGGIDAVPAGLRALPVLNNYGFGGALILKGVRPYIDGRADLYGDSFMLEHHAAVQGDGEVFERARRKWGIRWTILAPDDGLVRVLDGKSGWRRVYSDEFAVVHMAT